MWAHAWASGASRSERAQESHKVSSLRIAEDEAQVSLVVANHILERNKSKKSHAFRKNLLKKTGGKDRQETQRSGSGESPNKASLGGLSKRVFCNAQISPRSTRRYFMSYLLSEDCWILRPRRCVDLLFHWKPAMPDNPIGASHKDVDAIRIVPQGSDCRSRL